MVESVRLEMDGVLARITLVNGAKGNPLGLEFGRELRAIAIDLEGMSDLRAVLWTAEGKNFSVGGNLGAFADVDDLAAYVRESTADYHSALSRLMRLRAPMVSAVQGACAGAGVALAALSDIVIASSDSSFTIAYTAIGFSPDGASTYVLPRLIGLRRFQELVLTNRRVLAEEALAIGLVTQLEEPSRLLESAEAVAARLAEGPTGAYGATKRLLLQTFGSDLECQLEMESRLLSEQCGGTDVREGIAATIGKRRASFGGN